MEQRELASPRLTRFDRAAFGIAAGLLAVVFAYLLAYGLLRTSVFDPADPAGEHVLYVWDKSADNNSAEQNMSDILFKPAYTVHSRTVKRAEVEKLIAEATAEDVRSFLAEILTDNEKLCLRFYNIVNKEYKKTDVQGYFRQVDLITRQYAGRD